MKPELVNKYVKNFEGLKTDLREGLSEIFVKQLPSEAMVVFLFGKVFKHLKFVDIVIKDEKKGGLDAVARFEDRDVIIEFESYSKHFTRHRHDASQCNIIVCGITIGRMHLTASTSLISSIFGILEKQNREVEMHRCLMLRD